MTIIRKFCSVCVKEIKGKGGYYIQITRRWDLARENGFVCEKCYKKLEEIWGEQK